MDERLNASDMASAALIAGGDVGERLVAIGRFWAQHVDKDGNVLWEDEFPNLVTTPGKNLLLDTLLAGSAYSVTGPYMGLIDLTSYTAVAAADTMASHGGWLEAGGTNAPAYSGNRKTAVFSAASAGAKALSAALNFTFTSGGTVKGLFIVLGTGAVNTKDDTNGTLFSAGLFSGGDRLVANTDQINASWSLSV